MEGAFIMNVTDTDQRWRSICDAAAGNICFARREQNLFLQACQCAKKTKLGGRNLKGRTVMLTLQTQRGPTAA
jgi:hypothetical protein